MPQFSELLQQGTAHAWLFVPSAILLGALHGLEPGHSKTMMAAFIVAIRGTVRQAILLGLAATVSHTAVVWGIALAGLYFWGGVSADFSEPMFQLVSGVVIICVAIWMMWQTYADNNLFVGEQHKHGEARRIDTTRGVVELSIFEDGVPPRWRLKVVQGHGWQANEVSVDTRRSDGGVQTFKFVQADGYLESCDLIAEPHEFSARLSLGHDSNSHSHDLVFSEHDHSHHHDDTFARNEGSALNLANHEADDAHARAHENDIRRRFTGGRVTTGQIALFGLTGGLIPCPAAITILIICLQLKQFALGATLVLGFSVGLALTLVSVGVAAALSVGYATQRYSWLSAFGRKAPYFSSGLILMIGLYMASVAWRGLHA